MSISHTSCAGGDDGIRTHDPLLAGQVLSQLSYTPRLNLRILLFLRFSFRFCGNFTFGLPKISLVYEFHFWQSQKFHCKSFGLALVGPSGLEPPTSCLSGTRSNLLSYDPMWLAWFSHHSVIFRVKDGRFRPYLLMSALSYLPVQSPVKYFHHWRD